ncbi:DUF5802 family protein [Haloarchaeobius sp. DFWS5]|uniref:DUF5802 family protein n=1 Tax=Haloarchaeobius sp. DFWS5 TaxID=3446114 RepID=UPI003EC008F9
MFEEFSRGYYFGRMYVVPYDGDRPVMQRDQYAHVRRQVYPDETCESDERTLPAPAGDDPLVMKVDQSHLAVTGEAAVPADTLAVPRRILDRTSVDGPHERKEVFLAKADRADQLLELTGYRDVEPFGIDESSDGFDRDRFGGSVGT